MKVYGALEAAQIEWFTNAGKPAASSYPFRVIYVTDLKQIQVSDGTNWNPSALYTYTAGTLPAAGASNQYQVAFITDTLQVKVSNGTEWKTIGARLDTYTSGTIPAAASNTNSIIWVSDLQQVQVSNGTAWVQVGSKAGTKNYFSQNNANSDFETNSVSPWSACTLTFSSGVPSGAPTLTATQMSIATTATTPLSGTYSMLLTKAAANAQYQGFISGALTIDREDTAKVLYGSFYYEVVSGTIDLSGSSTQSLEIWIYNTVSGQWTQPAGYRGMNQSSGVGKVVFSFQTDGTYANNAYRIAVITQQTSTSSYVVEFDDFQVGPQAIVLGSAITDWQSFTATGSWTTNTSYAGKWRRVGDTAEIEYYVSLSGAPNATALGLYLPSGMIMDTSKLPFNNPNTHSQLMGMGQAWKAGTAYNLQCYVSSTTSITLCYQSTTNASQSTVTNLQPISWGNGDYITFFYKVPIAGWGSFSQMSSDTDTRVVAAKAYRNSAFTTTAGATAKIALDAKDIDSNGAFDTTNGRINILISGYYSVSGSVSFNIGGVVGQYASLIYKNGNPVSVADAYGSGSIYVAPSTSCVIYCNAGDYIELYCFNSNTGVPLVVGSVARTFLSVNRLSGSSVITATETVACRYTNTSGQAIAQNTETTVTNWTKDYDTHSFFAGSTGVVTIPVSGKYLVNMSVLFSSAAFGSASQYSIILAQAGSVTRAIVLNSIFPFAAGTNYVQISGSETFNAFAGDTITVRVFQNTGTGTRSLDVSNTYNHIAFTRVGN